MTSTTFAKRKFASFSLAVIMSAVSVAAMADVMVGGAAMLPTKDIIDNAVNSKDHTRTSAKAHGRSVESSGLLGALQLPQSVVV